MKVELVMAATGKVRTYANLGTMIKSFGVPPRQITLKGTAGKTVLIIQGSLVGEVKTCVH